MNRVLMLLWLILLNVDVLATPNLFALREPWATFLRALEFRAGIGSERIEPFAEQRAQNLKSLKLDFRILHCLKEVSKGATHSPLRQSLQEVVLQSFGRIENELVRSGFRHVFYETLMKFEAFEFSGIVIMDPGNNLRAVQLKLEAENEWSAFVGFLQVQCAKRLAEVGGYGAWIEIGKLHMEQDTRAGQELLQEQIASIIMSHDSAYRMNGLRAALESANFFPHRDRLKATLQKLDMGI